MYDLLSTFVKAKLKKSKVKLDVITFDIKLKIE